MTTNKRSPQLLPKNDRLFKKLALIAYPSLLVGDRIQIAPSSINFLFAKSSNFIQKLGV